MIYLNATDLKVCLKILSYCLSTVLRPNNPIQVATLMTQTPRWCGIGEACLGERVNDILEPLLIYRLSKNHCAVNPFHIIYCNRFQCLNGISNDLEVLSSSCWSLCSISYIGLEKPLRPTLD